MYKEGIRRQASGRKMWRASDDKKTDKKSVQPMNSPFEGGGGMY